MTAMRMTDDEFDEFCRKSEDHFRSLRGPRKAAITRLHRMVEMACEYLPTAKLNWLSVHMAIHMDSEEVERGATFHSGLSRQIREEIEREQATSKRGRRSTQTRFEKGVSPEDRKLFRQFGIKT